MADFAKKIIVDFWAVLAEMSPYLLFGFAVAGLLSVFISPKLVERHLGGRGIWPILKASLFGIPLPLCSCGVIPVSMSLRKSGASKGATISFLLSTPQTGVDSFLVTLSLLGPVFAVFRPVVTFITGLIGGSLVQLFDPDQPQTEVNEEQAETQNNNAGKKPGKFRQAIRYGFVVLPRDIGRAMLIGLVIAAFISALVPDDFFARSLGTGLFAMLVMVVVGIPIYVCATASVPLAAAMILKGLTPGAALVFLMTGPATNAAAFVTIWKLLGGRTALAYIITVVGCAVAAGLLLDHIAIDLGVKVIHQHQWMLPAWLKNISAVILLAILAKACWRPLRQLTS
jgi:uncharacterized membrane protein YraQ (UPF0718 family)